MVHFADYLPHNRKAASANSNHGSKGVVFATPITARLVRLEKERRLSRAVANIYQFEKELDNLVDSYHILSKHAADLKDLRLLFENHFCDTTLNGVSAYIVLNERRNSFKEILFVRYRVILGSAQMKISDGPNGKQTWEKSDPCGQEAMLLRCISLEGYLRA